MAQYDANGDGVLDAGDPVFSELVAWSDTVVRDGKVTPGELSSLPDLRVLSIDLSYVGAHERDRFDNVTRQRGGISLATAPIGGAMRRQTSVDAQASLLPKLGASTAGQVVDIWFRWAD